MTKHPDTMPDEMVRKLADLAREHGYGFEQITLTWLTRDLGPCFVGRAIYAPEIVESRSVDGETQNTEMQEAVAIGDRAICVGDVVTWDGEQDGWIVRAIEDDLRVRITPLVDDWGLGEQIVDAEDLLT